MGHDSAAKALLPEKDDDPRKKRRPIGVYRSPTFNAPFEERVQKDAEHLLKCGLAPDIDTAVDLAIEAIIHPKYRKDEENND